MKFLKTKWGKFLLFFFICSIIVNVGKTLFGPNKKEINEKYLTETSFSWSPSNFGGVYYRLFFNKDGSVELRLWNTGVVGGSTTRYPSQYGKWKIIDSKSVRIIGTEVAGLYKYKEFTHDERGLKSSSKELGRNKERY